MIEPRHKIADCKQTLGACPSQWDIRTTDGDYIYARYRWGYLSLTIHFGTCKERTILMMQTGDDMDGIMSTDELIQCTSPILDWSLVLGKINNIYN